MKRLVGKAPLLCVLLGAILAVILFAVTFSNKEGEAVTSLLRPNPGEGSKEYELSVLYEGESERVRITVNEKKLTFTEAQEIFAKGYDEILEAFNEKNGASDSVGKDLYLPESVLGDLLEITWHSSDSDYIENDGTLGEKAYKELPAEGLVVIMYAKVSLQEYSAEFEVPIYLLRENIVSDEEDVRTVIEKKLLEAEKEEAFGECVNLPKEVEGKDIIYYEEAENDCWYKPLLFGVFAAMVIFLLQKHKRDKLNENRIRELELSFAPIITKFTLLVGAGSSIRGAWEKIVKDYRDENYKNAAFEEMQRTLNEIKNGMSEREAYILFGKRCRLSQYIRFSNLLEQNLRKGTKGLSERLEHEVWEAFENRKALAVKLGEEAGTKLLLPMIMLLGIVIAVCVVPAFLSM